MSDLVERELSRILQELPDERSADPTFYLGVQQHARRIRRMRYAGAALAAAVAVTIAAITPSVLLSHNSRSSPPAGGSNVATWSARGGLATDAAVRQSAIRTWERALKAAHRGKLAEPVHEIYADHVPDVGIVVVLSGPEPRGGMRSVVLTGPDAKRLSLRSDVPLFAPSGIAVYLPLPAGGFVDPCPAGQPFHVERLLVLTPPGKHSARWNNGVCDDPSKGRWHNISLTDGVGFANVPKSGSWLTTVDIDREAEKQGISNVRQDGLAPAVRLTGGRVAAAVDVTTMAPPTSSRTADSHGGSVSVGGSASLGGIAASPKHGDGRPREGGDAIGWARRSDASPSEEDIFAALSLGQSFWHAFPSHGSVSSGQEFIRLALPDGTLFWGDLTQYPTGPTRIQVTVIRSATDVSGYLDIPVDPAHLPVELSAVVEGRDGNGWLAVAGAPGVAYIDYRAPGSRHWQSLDVYESTAFLKLPHGDDGTGTIRLRTTNGSTVYEGHVEALHALN
ncbi:MAG: hypothetical protein ACJ735_08735 [Actinomycetes bacterium]